MIIELANHSELSARDGNPCVTSIHIPESDEHELGGYTHRIGGVTGQELRAHFTESMTHHNGITELPNNEALVSIMAAWHSQADGVPNWVKAYDHPLTPAGRSSDIETVLADAFQCDVASDAVLATKEDLYWTRFGAPGHGEPQLPPLTALFTDVGRVQQANNYGGGLVGTSGTLTASSATTAIDNGAAWTTNMFVGFKAIAAIGPSGALVWGNITANSATVLTVDRWYTFATPGGAAATTSGTGVYAIPSGGSTSAWFVAMSTTNWTVTPPLDGNTSLAGEYVAAGGGLNRKIAPFAITYGLSPMTYTLAPVWTANSNDVLPFTAFQAAAFTSMVVGATPALKFATPLSATVSLTVSGQQAVFTSIVQGS